MSLKDIISCDVLFYFVYLVVCFVTMELFPVVIQSSMDLPQRRSIWLPDCSATLPAASCQLPAASYGMQRLQPLLRIRHRYRPAVSRHGLIHFNGANQWSAVGDECRHLLNSRSKCAITSMASTGDRISDHERVQNADRYTCIMYICRFPQADTFVKIPYNVCYVAVATNW